MAKIRTILKLADWPVRIDRPEMSNPIPTTPEARAEHDKHKEIVSALWPKLKAAERRAKTLVRELEEEMNRWGKAMAEVQPELKDVEYFEINDDGTQCRVPLEDLHNSPTQPEWARKAGKTAN